MRYEAPGVEEVMAPRTAWWTAIGAWAIGLVLGGAAAWKMDSTPTQYPTGMFEPQAQTEQPADSTGPYAAGVTEQQPVDIDQVTTDTATSCGEVTENGYADSSSASGAVFMPEDTVVAKRNDVGATQMQSP